jgi:hypothetical protein
VTLMKFLEKSPQRLAFRLGLPYLNSTHCDFDRTTGRAKFARVSLFWPRKVVDVPLTDITGVQVLVAQVTSEGGDQPFPQIAFSSRKPMSLPAVRGTSAHEAVAAMKAFLGT